MSILFGIVFILVGLTLAVLLGIVLYREPKGELLANRNILKAGKDLTAV
jgi:hypothetical protein